jgi:biotin carboxylase
MKTVMLIGGGVQEVRAVEFAQRLGYRVVVTDRSADAPCVAVADEAFVVDGRDTEQLVEIGRDLAARDRLHGVFTLTELVESVAAVTDACGFPGASVESAVICQDKGLAKKHWLEASVSTPDGGVVSSLDEAVQVFERLGRPSIIKPVEGFGAIGVRAVDDRADLDDYFSAIQGGGRWVVEERITGASHDVNGLFDGDGIFHPQGIADREFVPGTFAEHQVHAPTRLHDRKQSELYSLLEEAARAFGIDSGPVKGDAILSDGRFVMLEIAPRLHGPKMSLYALPESGLDHWADFFSVITGGPIVGSADLPQRFFQSNSIPAEAGLITEISGVEEVETWPGIVEVMMFKGVGDTAKTTVNSTDVVGYVLVATESAAESQGLIEKALGTIEVVVE